MLDHVENAIIYATICIYPIDVRLYRSNLMSRVGQIFLQIMDMGEEGVEETAFYFL